ncbi:MAG TPA: hypothetical protein VFV05_00285 [Methylomirabilota bacterium]|nr:hypothetical protein [Methylomirabilota bacterium]
MTLVLELVLTPLLIAAASLAGRRWGQAVGGWLVGLPLTTGPVAFFLALDHGTAFATVVALGSLAGAIAEGAFCLAYGHLARRGPAVALSAACAAFALAAAALRGLALPLTALGLLVFATLAMSLWFMPSGSGPADPAPPPRWDIAARMAVTTALVVGLTAIAPALGPRPSGILAAFPLYAAILTVFAHRAGAAPAVQVLRGLLLGLFSFAAFFVVLAALLERLGTGGAFVAATAVALAAQGASLGVVLAARRSSTLGRA